MTVEEIIEAAGGVRELAEAVGVSRCSVYDWRRWDRIPVARAQAIHEKLGIPLHELRPDVWRASAAAAN